MVDGLGNLEVKESEPIKEIQSFRKIINGESSLEIINRQQAKETKM